MSTLKVNTIQNTSGASSSTPAQIAGGRAKVWALINMSSASILDSFGVSSITDSTTGTFNINFSTALSNVNACSVASSSDSSLHTQIVDGNCSTSAFQYRCLDGGGSLVDDPFTSFVLFDN
tara:strand:- start:236 stop:598 length:363 start_codon:yes stop_codon:yes gene_type:complete